MELAGIFFLVTSVKSWIFFFAPKSVMNAHFWHFLGVSFGTKMALKHDKSGSQAGPRWTLKTGQKAQIKLGWIFQPILTFDPNFDPKL